MCLRVLAALFAAAQGARTAEDAAGGELASGWI